MLLHTTPNKNMGDPQFYLHGKAFSTTLSTRCRKNNFNFTFAGTLFQIFACTSAPQCSSKWISGKISTQKLQFYLSLLRVIRNMCNFYTSSCTFSDMFDTRFRKHAILLGFCAHYRQHAQSYISIETFSEMPSHVSQHLQFYVVFDC